MNQETQGMFGSNELLASLEAQDKYETLQPARNHESTLDKIEDQQIKKSRLEITIGSEITIKQVESNYNSSKVKGGYNSAQNSTEKFLPLSSLPAVETAFSIKKIREKIWSFINPNDLFKVRLVSLSLRRYATDFLVKSNRDKIKLTVVTTYEEDEVKEPDQILELEGPELEDSEPEEPKPLNIMRALSSVLDSTGSNEFPITGFNITSSNKQCDTFELNLFLNKHGSRIKRLNLNYLYFKTCDEEYSKETLCSCGKSWLNRLVTKLFLEQAPNLEKLKLYWIPMNIKLREVTCQQQPRLQQQSSENSISKIEIVPPTSKPNLNLRFVSFTQNIEASLFDLICALAPKLEKVATTTANLHYFLEPTNRLHLLKKLTYDPDPDESGERLGVIKRIANTEGVLTLKELKLNVLSIEDESEYEDIWPEVADVCNKLLQKCCSSLKNLYLQPLGFLPGIKVPQMPNVEYIYYQDFLEGDSSVSFLPKGTRTCEVFPKLNTIRLPEDFTTRRKTTENTILNGVHEAVPSVRVIVKAWKRSHVEILKRWFPNAEFIRSMQVFPF